MARKNKRWSTHQGLEVQAPRDHTCIPVPTRWGHLCLTCGRPMEVNR